jgi:hypothetical protein
MFHLQTLQAISTRDVHVPLAGEKAIPDCNYADELHPQQELEAQGKRRHRPKREPVVFGKARSITGPQDILSIRTLFATVH